MVRWSARGMVSAAPIRHATSSAKARREMAITRAPASVARRVSSAPRKPMPTMATVWPGRDAAAAEDVQRAAQRLTGERLVGQAARQADASVRRRQVILRVGMLGERRDPVAECQAGDPRAQCIDDSPTFMAKRPRRRREGHPVGPGPWPEVGRADPAPQHPHADLPGARVRPRHPHDLHPAGPGEDRRPHDRDRHGGG